MGFLGGLLGVLLWFALLRYANPMFWISPLVPWSLVAATIALVQLQKNRILAAASVPSCASAEQVAIVGSSIGDAASVSAD